MQIWSRFRSNPWIWSLPRSIFQSVSWSVPCFSPVWSNEVTKLMGYCTIFCHCNHLLFIHYVNYGSVVLSWQHSLMPIANGLETVCLQILYFELVFKIGNNLAYFISCSHQFMLFWSAIYGLKELISFVISGSFLRHCYLNLISPLSVHDHYHEGNLALFCLFGILSHLLSNASFSSVTVLYRNQKIIPSCI